MEFNDRRSGNIYNLSWYREQKQGRSPRQTVIGAGKPMSPREIALGHIRTKHGLMPGAFHQMPVEQVLRVRSEEHTSELQSRQYLVCRLLLEKKKKKKQKTRPEE